MILKVREIESRITAQEGSIRMKNEFAGYQVQMNELMMRVTEQLNALELMHKEMEKKLKGEQQEGCGVDERIDELPSFPLFSGTEPTPKDECRIETFLFHVRGAWKNLTDQEIQAALISSLRGGPVPLLNMLGLILLLTL